MPISSAPSICFLAATLVADGAERQLLFMLRALRDLPLACRVMTLTEGEALEDEIRALGLPIEYVGGAASPPARLAAVIASLRRQPADIVQSTHFYSNPYVGIAARVIGSTSVGAVRNDLWSEIEANRPFGPACLHLPHFLAVNSRIARERAIARGRSPSRVALVENAVSVSRFDAARSGRRDDDNGSINLLFVGRLVRQKRVEFFLRAVREVQEAYPHLRVEARVVGDGPRRAELESLAGELGLSHDHVRFLGVVADTVPHYRWAHILILPSDNEGTPNVVLESMASELPVIATTVGGVPDLLAAGGGVLVEPGDGAVLARAAIELVGDAERRRRMGAEGRARVEDGYSERALSRTLHGFYRTVLSGG